MGIGGLDRSWRLSACCHRTKRAWNQYGVKRSAERLIKLASHGKHYILQLAVPSLCQKRKVLLLCGVGVVCWCCGVL